MDGKGRFDLYSDQVGSMALCKLVDLGSWREGTLKSHVARGAGGAEEYFSVVGGKHVILDRCSDEAV